MENPTNTKTVGKIKEIINCLIYLCALYQTWNCLVAIKVKLKAPFVNFLQEPIKSVILHSLTLKTPNCLSRFGWFADTTAR
jgi:hypothetical protein